MENNINIINLLIINILIYIIFSIHFEAFLHYLFADSKTSKANKFINLN